MHENIRGYVARQLLDDPVAVGWFIVHEMLAHVGPVPGCSLMAINRAS